jgi:hypothetical protein
MQDANEPWNEQPGEPGDEEPKVTGNGLNWDDVANIGIWALPWIG